MIRRNSLSCHPLQPPGHFTPLSFPPSHMLWDYITHHGLTHYGCTPAYLDKERGHVARPVHSCLGVRVFSMVGYSQNT
jgi:hypothetical protein